MDEDKRRIIVAEIMQWRRSKLLPEQYCNFLLNLYKVDHDEDKVDTNKFKSILPSKPRNWKAWILSTVLIALLAFIIYSFVMNNLVMQVAVTLVFIVFCYVSGILYRHRMPLLSNGLSGIASFAMLIAGIFIMRDLDGTQSVHYIVYIAICALIWLFVGLVGRMRLLQACGLIALLITYSWMLNNPNGDMNWLTLQLSFIPLALLLIWVGWLIHHRNKEIASVLLFVGIAACIAPELFGMFIPKEPDLFVMQLSLISKLLIGSIIMIITRKKWMEWVV
jgi:hypothetical protein